MDITADVLAVLNEGREETQMEKAAIETINVE
jgi:hypothetical protein